jgi:hypothetical protein
LRDAGLPPCSTPEDFVRILSSLCLILSLGLPALARASETTGSSITLSWTAPGDDSLSGTATSYELRYSITPITPQNFQLASPVAGMPAPASPRTRQSMTVSALAPSQTYYFAMRTADERGNWSGISNVIHKTAPSSPVEVDAEPLKLSFSNPWPNPARNSARVSFTLPTEAEIAIVVFDVTGRLVRTLARGPHAAGQGDLIWDLGDDLGHPVSAGMYLMRARLANQTFIKRVIVTH